MHTSNAMNIVNLVVWIIEGSDNRGSTVFGWYNFQANKVWEFIAQVKCHVLKFY